MVNVVESGDQSKGNKYVISPIYKKNCEKWQEVVSKEMRHIIF